MSNQSYIALCGLGADRIGLVAEITGFVTARGANVEDSRMAVLGSHFGVLLLVSGTAEQLDAVEQELPSLQASTGVAFVTGRTRSPEEYRAQAGMPFLVTAHTLDHPGIVQAVARTLVGAGVNIVSLETTAYEAPVTGSQLFRMTARVDLPAGLAVSKIRKTLEEVSDELNLDLELRPIAS